MSPRRTCLTEPARFTAGQALDRLRVPRGAAFLVRSARRSACLAGPTRRAAPRRVPGGDGGTRRIGEVVRGRPRRRRPPALPFSSLVVSWPGRPRPDRQYRRSRRPTPPRRRASTRRAGTGFDLAQHVRRAPRERVTQSFDGFGKPIGLPRVTRICRPCPPDGALWRRAWRTADDARRRTPIAWMPCARTWPRSGRPARRSTASVECTRHRRLTLLDDDPWS